MAVISLWGPSDRITEDRFDGLGALVSDAAHELAATLLAGAGAA